MILKNFNKILDVLPAIMKSPSSLSNKKIISKSPSKQRAKEKLISMSSSKQARKEKHLLKQHKDTRWLEQQLLSVANFLQRKIKNLFNFEYSPSNNFLVPTPWHHSGKEICIRLRFTWKKNESQVS